jgi:hypothetical protein
MTNEDGRSHLDGIIDGVVQDLMQKDARGDLTARVMRGLREPAPRPWFLGSPALAAASFAVIVLVAAAMLLLRQPERSSVPSIEVASGLPADLPSSAPAPSAPAVPLPAGTDRAARVRPAAPAATPSSESIFGPRRGEVGAASVRASTAIWVELTLVETSPSGEVRRQPVTLVLRRDAQPGTAISRAEGSFQLAVVPEFVPNGVNLVVDLQSPLSRKFTAPVRPAEVERSQIFESVDPQSGRRTVIEARARFLNPDAQR